MNTVILMGRLTRDPEVRYTQGEKSMAVARYTLAVDRRRAADSGGQNTDFISCVAFDRAGEFAEKYFRQGQRVLVRGRIQTGSYVNRDGPEDPIRRMWSSWNRSLQTAEGTEEAAAGRSPRRMTGL